jgi:predicted phosphodiesterase
MRVAVFGDVHGNLVALERFISSTRSEVDSYLCLGDTVNYGPWNDECLELIYSLPGCKTVQGNHERLFLGLDDISLESSLVRDFFDASHSSLSRTDLIRELPLSITLGAFDCRHTIDNKSIHGDTPVQLDRNYFIGHTHHQFRLAGSGFELINPGSVGQNRRWIDRIDYAIVDMGSNKIELHSLSYDVDAFISELRARRYPAQCIAYYANKARHGL